MFISLLLVAVLTFISVICETVRIRGCRICAAVLTDAATESVMAAYDRQMLDQLGIFGHYCSDTAAVAQTVSDEIQRMLSPEREYVLPRRSDFYRLHLQQAECTECTYLTDQGGKAFYEQAVCFMKDQAPAHMLAFLKNYAEGSQSTEELEDYYKNEEKNIKDKTNEYLEEADGQEGLPESQPELSGQPVMEKSPMDTMRELKEKGILALVLPADRKISDYTVSPEDCVSHRLQQETKEPTAYDTGPGQKAIFVTYLADRFPSFTDQEESTGLQCKLEYCLAGKATDTENLKYVVNRLLLWKEAANMAYLMTDAGKKGEALAAALALTGAFGIEPLVRITEYAILLAWAYAESILDVRNLLNGGSSALIKTQNNWKLSLEKIGDTASYETEAKQEDGGLQYETYVKLLLMFQDGQKLCLYGMDAAEMRMREVYQEDRYCLNQVITALTVQSSFDSSSVFAGFADALRPDIRITSGYSYL